MFKQSYVYGPVPSRRLGLSLGLSIVPGKTCTLDCIYCQCGRTSHKTLKRESFFPINDILVQVHGAIAGKRVDFLTFSGEGEPCLNKDIGKLIRRLKQEFTIPVAVITNSTLLTEPTVRRALYPADLVVPSLDAADQATFGRVNRNHRDLKIAEIIQGLGKFRRYYKGRLWLEIMLVKGVNDSVEELVKLRKAVALIRPDRVHLNTVVRPPAEKKAKPLSHDALEQIQMLFGPGTEIAEPTIRKQQREFKGDAKSAIIELVQRRPVTKKDIERSLGIKPEELSRVIGQLIRAKKVRLVEFLGKSFYEAA